MAGLAECRSALPFPWVQHGADWHRPQCSNWQRAGAPARRGPGALLRQANP